MKGVGQRPNSPGGIKVYGLWERYPVGSSARCQLSPSPVKAGVNDLIPSVGNKLWSNYFILPVRSGVRGQNGSPPRSRGGVYGLKPGHRLVIKTWSRDNHGQAVKGWGQ
jgi:hypothetical protein